MSDEMMDTNLLLEKHAEDIKSQAQTAVEQMENVRENLKAAIDARFRKVKVMIDKAVAEETAVIYSPRPDISQKRNRVTALIAMIERYEKFEEHEYFRDMVSIVKGRARDLDLETTVPARVKDNREVTFDVDLEKVARFEEQLSQLGQVSFSPVSSDTAGKPDVRTQGSDVTSASNSDVTTQTSPAPPSVLRFHDNRGSAVGLSKRNKTARRTSSGLSGLVISQHAMMTEKWYQVRIDEVSDRCGSLELGVLTTMPDQYTVPEDFHFSDHKAVCLYSRGQIMEFGKLKEDSRLLELHEIQEGSEVGLSLTSSRNLYLRVNGKVIGSVAENIKGPCYFVFNLFGRCRKVSALQVVSYQKYTAPNCVIL